MTSTARQSSFALCIIAWSALLRGEMLQSYPSPFIDVAKLGYAGRCSIPSGC